MVALVSMMQPLELQLLEHCQDHHQQFQSEQTEYGTCLHDKTSMHHPGQEKLQVLKDLQREGLEALSLGQPVGVSQNHLLVGSWREIQSQGQTVKNPSQHHQLADVVSQC